MKLKNYKAWKTTALGMTIIVASMASVFVKESLTWSDAAIGIAIGLMLVFSPDTILDKIMKLLKVLILVFLTSCMSQKKLAKVCADKFPVKDSTIIIEKIDTTYEYVKGDSIRVQMVVHDSVLIKDTICPPVKIPKVTRYKEKIVYQENTAKVFVCESELKKVTQKCTKLEHDNAQLVAENKKYKKIGLYALFGLLVIVALIVLKVVRSATRLW
jgi:hypothetical protein